MNAVEIEEAVSVLAEQEFNGDEFPYAFLEAFGNKATTIKKLKSGASNKSDVGGVLQTNNIHIKVCEPDQVAGVLKELRDSPATAKAKAKFVLATDGKWLEAEDLRSGETIACDYPDFHNHFGFFLSLAGISTVKAIRESAFDIKATGRLNKLYVELLRHNPEWGTDERRHEMNHFMARLIFCFFAEDTEIFPGEDLFTSTIETMSERDGANTHEIISELFRAMDIKPADRDAAGLRSWADKFPYVNGGLFSDSHESPKFTRTAKNLLRHIGELDWKRVNPDIFGSMIQAVADDDERGALGMHYTSVSNILKVLNPLFLDELREKLEEAGDNGRKLLNLRTRLSKIRVFDPACGSGNFLVIAYKEMRAIEAEINKRRGEPDRRTAIPLTNFRGIELRDFPAEIARLALIIAEYQCDVLYRGQKEALKDVLPLDAVNWITCGNALRLDWLSICPPTGAGVKHHADDLFHSPVDQAEIDFENEGGETYICGNPPYLGSRAQTKSQKDDLAAIFEKYTKSFGVLDYVSGWFVKAAEYGVSTDTVTAFVSTNSICQGQQVPVLWPIIGNTGHEIVFAHSSFKWANLASQNAGVTVIVVGISNKKLGVKKIYSNAEVGASSLSEVVNINPYLAPSKNVFVFSRKAQLSGLVSIDRGSAPTDDGHLFFDRQGFASAVEQCPEIKSVLIPAIGGADFIRGNTRWVLKVSRSDLRNKTLAGFCEPILNRVATFRAASKKDATRQFADRPFEFPENRHFRDRKIFIPQVMSEDREYITGGLLAADELVIAPHFQADGSEVFPLSIISSRLHIAWVKAVCGQLETRIRYSNTLGWNTFPVPKLTEKNKADLTKCAEDILLARESHFPATIADLYDPEKMPANLREAHERNDEVLERIYIGRRFKNDTERLEKLFDLYTKMTSKESAA